MLTNSKKLQAIDNQEIKVHKKKYVLK